MMRLVRRPGSPYWYVRGSINGERRYFSTKTTDRESAERVRRDTEDRALRAVVDDTEVWLPIPGYEGYEVTATGRVRRAPSPDIAQRANWQGYPFVSLSNGTGKQRILSVHRAVALAFLGPPPAPGAQVCHRDGDKTNASARNLYWGTGTENGRDRRLHNLQKRLARARGPERTALRAEIAELRAGQP